VLVGSQGSAEKKTDGTSISLSRGICRFLVEANSEFMIFESAIEFAWERGKKRRVRREQMARHFRAARTLMRRRMHHPRLIWNDPVSTVPSGKRADHPNHSGCHRSDIARSDASCCRARDTRSVECANSCVLDLGSFITRSFPVVVPLRRDSLNALLRLLTFRSRRRIRHGTPRVRNRSWSRRSRLHRLSPVDILPPGLKLWN